MYNFIATGVLSSTAVLTFGELLAPRLVVLSLGAGFGYLTGLFTSTSGGYLNPAVTASLMALYPLNKGNMSPLKGLMNMLAQLIGTAVGIALVVRFLLLRSLERRQLTRNAQIAIVPDADKSNENLGVPALTYGTSSGSGFAIEALGAFFITWIVLANEAYTLAGPRSTSTPIALGTAMTSLQLFAFPFTTACFNPVRALCLFLFSGTSGSDLITFVSAPFLGSLVATGLYLVAFTNSSVLQTASSKSTKAL